MALLKMPACMRTARIPAALATVAWVALLAGCTAGPDFRAPAPPGSAALLAAAQPLHTAPSAAAQGEAQHGTADMDMAAPWWRRFGSPPLDALIAQALAASPTLAAAEATLRQAQEMEAAQTGATQRPRVDANAGSQRQRISPSAQGLPGEGRSFGQYSASIGVRYTLDLAGGNRRALEALSARTGYRRYQLEGARLNLAASIVGTAITQARLAAQLEALQAIVQMQEAQLHLSGERLRLGQAAHSEVLTLQAQVDQTRASVPLLRQQHQQSRHLLATLTGQAPVAQVLPDFTLKDFTLPDEQPLIVPSEWVRLRPDIQGAQALLHAAHADYGVAVARLYPQVNLSASLGSQALTTGALFGGSAAVWSLIGQLTQPLFNPALPAEKRAALAALDAAAANYQGVVLDALRSVADALHALDNDTQALAAQVGADAAAQGSLQSMQRQYALGSASYLQLLVAQQQAQQIRTDLAAAQARRLLGRAALYQAVGAGWAGAPQSGHGR